MIMRALQWKMQDDVAAKELEHRKKVIDKNKNILHRAWF